MSELSLEDQERKIAWSFVRWLHKCVMERWTGYGDVFINVEERLENGLVVATIKMDPLGMPEEHRKEEPLHPDTLKALHKNGRQQELDYED